MKVALVQSNPMPPTEGIANHIMQLAKHLRQNNHEVHLFTRGGWTGYDESFQGFPVHRPACPPLYPLHAHIHRIPLQRSIAKHGEFDLVHLHSPLVPFPRVDAPTVATVHTPIGKDVDSVPEDAPGQYLLRLQVPFSEAVERDLVDKADAVTCVSSSIKDLVKEDHDRPISVVNNGVDVSEFEPKFDGREENSLLYVGRLGRRKGIPRLLSVARHLRSKEVDFTLRIVGKGPLESEIKSTIAEENLGNHVKFLGFIAREKLLGLFQQTTMLVHLPEFEGLPTTVLEAMASGAPVVATDVPGCRDVVEDDSNGLLVQRGNDSIIADRIIELLDSPDKRRQFGENARATVENDFDWPEITEDYESVYREVTR